MERKKITWGAASDPDISDRSELSENVLQIVAIGVLQKTANVDLTVDVPVPVRHDCRIFGAGVLF